MNAVAALLFLTPFQGPIPFGNGGVEDFILTEKQAYMVLPPQAVGSSQTIFMSWSPSGRYLLMGQQRPQFTPALLQGALAGNRPAKPAMAVSLWDKTQNRTTELGSIPGFGEGFHWIAGKDVTLNLFVEDTGEASQERASLIRIDAASGKLSYLPISNPISEGVFYRLAVSPVSAIAILLETTYVRREKLLSLATTSHTWTIDELGRSSSKVSMPLGNPGDILWLQDGRALISMHRPSLEGKGTQERYAFDPKSGSISPVTGQIPIFRAQERESDLKVVMSQMLSPPGTPKRSQFSAWLKDAKQSAPGGEFLLSPRADAALLSPATDAVAILDLGVVTVRMLASVPKELYFQAKSAAEKAKALSEVKQVGLGAIMFAADNDDRLPSQDEFSSGVIGPYLKNNGMFEGFTYVFGGGSARDIKDPAGTMLGYKPVAGGFAIVFADGHAKWLNELPKNP